jgi:dimethylhistidine N-methyltransferase
VSRSSDTIRDPLVIDLHPPRSDIRADVLAGLSRPQKQLPPKYFYDTRGSTLFEEITRLPEYYPTRTEAGIMQRCLPEMASLIGPGAAIIEFGSGSGQKIRRLLSHLDNPVAAVTVEISRDHLEAAAMRQAAQFPDLEIIALCADFMRPFDLPPIPRARRKIVFFPGSTIGNLTRPEALQLLEVMRSVCGPDGAILMGVDLVKDTRVLEAAYNDSAGVTARFNRNLLERINREIGADFAIDRFRHQALYNSEAQRIEMYLISEADQEVHIAGEVYRFSQGERILTEYSHKYEIEGLSHLAKSAGLSMTQQWTDGRQYFAVVYLEPATG